MSLFKYFSEKQDTDGEPLWWPGGSAGYPFRGKNPPLTTEEEYLKLQPTGKFRSRLFFLSKEKDLRDYSLIRDKAVNGLYAIVDRDRQWDEESKNYRIYLEWVEIAYELPPTGAKNAFELYTNNPDVSKITQPFTKDKTGW